jgi:dihydropteroate synthase
LSLPRRAFDLPLPDGRVLHLGARCLVMGILNVTPDSFAETERFDTDAAVGAALRMAEQGADIVDIGGESTRPGADPVSTDEELGRVLPVVRALRGRLPVPLSIDTYKADVARAALAEGAVMINDVSGLRYDRSLARVAAETGAALVLMHTRGRSKNMYAEAEYGDLLADVAAELGESVAGATAAGVNRQQIIVDPGLGFAKRPAHSYGVLARLPELASALDRPLLVGPSRKSFLRAAIGDRPASERDWATAGAVAAAVLFGAHIVRVHAVPQMLDVVRVAETIRASVVADA